MGFSKRCKSLISKADNEYLILLAVAIITFFLHIHKLSYQSLWMDEGFYVLAAKKILKFGYPLYPSGYILFKSIFYSYLLGFFTFLFGQTVFTFRLLSVLLYLISPLLIFSLAKDYINKNILLIAGIIYFLFSWETEFSRISVYYSLLQLLFTVSIFCFINYTFFKKKHKYHIFWVLSSFTHQLSIGLAFSFPSLLLLKPKLFLKKKTLLSLIFWIPFFSFIMLQEVLFWNVGQVYSTQSLGIKNISEIVNYFFANFKLIYFKILYKSHPYSFPLFVIGGIILVLYILYMKFFSKKQLKIEILILSFIFFTFSFTLLFMGFMRTHPMPRYLFPFHFIYIILIISFIYYLLYFLKYFFHFLDLKIVTILLLLIFSYSIFNQVSISRKMEIIDRGYTDRINTDIIYTSGRYYPIDHESLGKYVKQNLKQSDVVIAIHMVYQYLYVGKVNYWLFSGGPGTWDAWEKVDGKWRDFYLGSEWINSVDKLKNIIKTCLNKNKRIWLITSTSEQNPAHINKNIYRFLRKNDNRVVWISKDGIGKVYLFSKNKEKLRENYYKAAWGIYNKKNLTSINNKSFVKIDKNSFYKTALIFNGKNKVKLTFNFRKSSNLNKKSIVRIQSASDGKIEKTSRFTVKKNTSRIVYLRLKEKKRYNIRLKLLKGAPIYLYSIDRLYMR